MAIGVHIALTHHQPVDGKERMRGHGALLGAVDTTVHVINKDGMRLAEVVKSSSDHEEGQRVGFTLKPVIIHQDDGYGDPVTAPVMVEGQAPTTAKAAKRAVKSSKERHARPECPARCRCRLRTAHGQCSHTRRRAGRHPRSMAGVRLAPRPRRRRPDARQQGLYSRNGGPWRKQARRHLGAVCMASLKKLSHGDKTDRF